MKIDINVNNELNIRVNKELKKAQTKRQFLLVFVEVFMNSIQFVFFVVIIIEN